VAFADPNAPFVAREILTADSGQRVTINDDTHPNGIAFYSGSPNEIAPAQLQPSNNADIVFGMQLSGATSAANPVAPSVSLTTDTITPRTQFGSNSDRLNLGAGVDAFIQSPSIKIGDFTSSRLVITGTPSNIAIEGEAWANIPLVNSWVDVAGGRANYYKDATGRVQLRGQVSGGTVATVATLPAGYRPTQSMEWIMRGVGGVVMCAVQVATTGVITVTANIATAQANGIKLDSISFPTF